MQKAQQQGERFRSLAMDAVTTTSEAAALDASANMVSAKLMCRSAYDMRAKISGVTDPFPALATLLALERPKATLVAVRIYSLLFEMGMSQHWQRLVPLVPALAAAAAGSPAAMAEGSPSPEEVQAAEQARVPALKLLEQISGRGVSPFHALYLLLVYC